MIATVQDAPALIRLFQEVYGGHYPLALGRDLAETQRLLALPSTHWRVIRDEHGGLIASAVVLVDTERRVGLLGGIAVHPDHGGRGLAHRVSAAACQAAFASGTLDSAYSTVRLCSPRAQEVVMDQGFHPTGVLPGAARLARQESLGFFVRHAPGAVERRSAPSVLPAGLMPLYSRALRNLSLADAHPPLANLDHTAVSPTPATVSLHPVDQHRYLATATTAAGLTVHLALDLNAAAGSAHLREVRPHPGVLPLIAPALYAELQRKGITYVEASVPLDRTGAVTDVQAYLAAGMAPAAYYPAARRRADSLHDLVILAHSHIAVEECAVRPCAEVAAFLSPKETETA